MPDGLPRGARRLVLLGASAGGVEALSTVVADLPPDLDAAVLVVLHVPTGISVLPAILERIGPLPARHAVDGEAIVPGRIYVAPPDHHMVVDCGHVRLSRSPRENGVRPSIDTLFRSAVHSHDCAVMAVVLSGALDDGTAGLLSVKNHGGTTVAQDPADASFPSMPESAARFAKPDHVVPADQVAGLIAKFAAERVAAVSARPSPEESLEPTYTAPAVLADDSGIPSGLNCPECGGAVWESYDGQLMRFRCRVGHAYSPESLFSHQLETLERCLWAAVAGLHERADMASRLASHMSGRAQHQRAIRFERQANEARQRAEQVRGAIVQLTRLDEPLGDE